MKRTSSPSHPSRFQRGGVRWSRDILGTCAIPAAREIPEHRIARLKLRDVPTYRFNPSRDVGPEDLVLWLAQPRREPNHKPIASQEMPVTGIYGCSMNVYNERPTGAGVTELEYPGTMRRG
jgi:hypothetical protein